MQEALDRVKYGCYMCYVHFCGKDAAPPCRQRSKLFTPHDSVLWRLLSVWTHRKLVGNVKNRLRV